MTEFHEQGWTPLPHQDAVTRRITAARVLTHELTPCANTGWLPTPEEAQAATVQALILLDQSGHDVPAALSLLGDILQADEQESTDPYGPHRAEHYAAAPALSVSGLYEAEVLLGWTPQVTIPGEPPIRRTPDAVAEILAGFVHLTRQVHTEAAHTRA